jgi:hypothetical protein
MLHAVYKIDHDVIIIHGCSTKNTILSATMHVGCGIKSGHCSWLPDLAVSFF